MSPQEADLGAAVRQRARYATRYRTIFISDTHLGTRGCQAGLLLDFLEATDAETYYLVGDIVDAWRLQRGWIWPQSHNDVVQAILGKAQQGARVIFIPGNHDEVLRQYQGTHFGGIEVQETADHVTADGRRFLVTHGDQFDAVIVNAKWLAYLGDRAYDFALWLNTGLHKVQKVIGARHWSLSNWAKQQVKQAVNYIGEYEAVLTAEAERGGYDGIVCGHIHSANMRDIDGIDYVNTGDWVESCTAIVERFDGVMQILDWPSVKRQQAQAAARSTGPRQREREVTQA